MSCTFVRTLRVAIAATALVGCGTATDNPTGSDVADQRDWSGWWQNHHRDAGSTDASHSTDSGTGSTDASSGGTDASTVADAGSATDARATTDAASTDTGSATDSGAGSTDASTPPTDSGTTVADASAPGTWWRPAPGTSWQWQLTGTIDQSVDAQMYDIDMFDNSATTIAQLHSHGRRVICYISAGTYENWRPDASSFPASVLGSSNGWPGEQWLDIRSSTVRDIMRRRMDLAVTKGCDGIEPDNIDGYTNRTGFPLTAADQLAYNRFLASEAHARNLSVGLKNDLDQAASLVGDFDWMLDEQCFQYNECDMVQPFLSAGKAVFETEYGSASLATSVCPQANSMNMDTLIKDLDLDAWRVSCR